MSNNTIGSLMIIILIVVIMLTGINFVGNEIQSNSNLDVRSQQVLTNLNKQIITNYDLNDFTTTNNSISGNTTCSGQDAFFIQSCIDTNTISEQKSSLNKIISFPTFMINILGFDTNEYFIFIIGLIIFMLGVYIAFAVYKALRTGEVD